MVSTQKSKSKIIIVERDSVFILFFIPIKGGTV